MIEPCEVDNWVGIIEVKMFDLVVIMMQDVVIVSELHNGLFSFLEKRLDSHCYKEYVGFTGPLKVFPVFPVFPILKWLVYLCIHSFMYLRK